MFVCFLFVQTIVALFFLSCSVAFCESGYVSGHSTLLELSLGTYWLKTVPVQECTPFAVIGSNTVVEARGQRVRGRLYPWGIVEGMFMYY